MLYWLLGCLFIVGQFGHQSQALTPNLLYTCHAWGDPHLQTWRAHDTPLTNDHQQDCFTNGVFDLVNNPFVHYTVQTHGTLIIAASLTFFNPTTHKQLCKIGAIDFLVLSTRPHECEKHGVKWTVTGTLLQFTVTISYLVGGTNFTTSIQREPSHFNVHVWQPQSWAAISSGLCTKSDPKCTRTRTSLLDTPTKIITYTEAQSICQAYIDAYLARSQQKRSLVWSNAVNSIMEGCVDDVVLTGDAEIAKSGLDVLLIEELTSGVTSAEGIKEAIDSGIQEGSSRMEEATQEARMKVARFL